MTSFRKGTIEDVNNSADTYQLRATWSPNNFPEEMYMSFSSHVSIWVPCDKGLVEEYVPVWWDALNDALPSDKGGYYDQMFIELNNAFKEENQEKIDSIRAVLELHAENKHD